MGNDRVSDEEFMGRNEYSRHQGVTPAAVLKAVRSGRIARAVVWGPDRKIQAIRWRMADRLWLENTDQTEALKTRKSPGPTAQASAPDGGADTKPASVQTSAPIAPDAAVLTGGPPAREGVLTARQIARAICTGRLAWMQGIDRWEFTTPHQDMIELAGLLIGEIEFALTAAGFPGVARILDSVCSASQWPANLAEIIARCRAEVPAATEEAATIERAHPTSANRPRECELDRAGPCSAGDGGQGSPQDQTLIDSGALEKDGPID